MELFKQTQIDFLGYRRITAVISALLILISLVAFFARGLNFGLEFTGGLQIEVAYQQAADLDRMHQQLAAVGYTESEAILQSYGASNDVLVRLPIKTQTSQQETIDQVKGALEGGKIQRVEYIGPQVGKELMTYGALAIVVSLLATMIYIAMRFEYRFAVSAALALLHDPILILGLFALCQWEFDLKVLAAMLAVIGYSLNDTIVVFDRVRENFRKLRKSDPVEIVNLSVNQTLSRTIITSGLTLVVVVALLLYGGPVIRGFSIALIIGIVIGTYSSIYVASALAVALGLNRTDFLPRERTPVDEMP